MSVRIPLSGPGVAPSPGRTRIRRIVTAVDAEGRSYVAEDAEARDVQVVADLPTFVYTDLWSTDSTPVLLDGPVDDGLPYDGGIAPPRDGSVLRIVEFPPDRDWDTGPRSRADMHHATASLDYALVLSGEIVAVLDRDERVMRAGEVLVQRGTAHSWSNRSHAPALVAFVLIGGRHVEDGAAGTASG